MFQCCKDTHFVNITKAAPLFLSGGYHSSLNTEASTEVTSYLFCIVYDPICRILVGPGALDTSLGLI